LAYLTLESEYFQTEILMDGVRKGTGTFFWKS
jgi:hypothetical protein